MIRAVSGWLRQMPMAIVAGILMGVLASFAVVDPLVAWYDSAYPVATGGGAIVRKAPPEIDMHLTVRKHRACVYIGLQAYERHRDGKYHDIYLRRVDVPEKGDTKTPGEYDIGTWRMWPVGDQGAAVLVTAQHVCGGRIVTSQIFEAAL